MTATGGDFAYDVADTIAPPEQSFLFSLLADAMNPPETDPNPYGSPKSTTDLTPGPTESEFLALLVAIVLSCLFLGVLYVLVPGVGIVATLVLVPAIVRWFICLRRKAVVEGHSLAPGQQISLFFISAFIMIPVLFASGITFFAVCGAGAMTAVSLFPSQSSYDYDAMFFGGVPAGLIAALAMMIFVIRQTIFPALPDQRKVAMEQPDDNETVPWEEPNSGGKPIHPDMKNTPPQ